MSKIISVIIAIYAGATSFMGALYFLEAERGITQPSTVTLFVVGVLSLFILCCSGIGTNEFIKKYMGKK